MIDKELLRQAAEDIDIFQDDLSREYDMIVRYRRTARLRRWAMAACVVMTLGISLTLYMYDTPTQQLSLAQNAQPAAVHTAQPALSASSASFTTEEAQLSRAQKITAATSAADNDNKGIEIKGENETASLVNSTMAKISEEADTHQPSRQTEKSIHIHENHADTDSQSAATEDDTPTSVDASTELLFAILSEMDARSAAEEEANQRLQRAILEEINIYATSKTDIIELTL